MPRSLDSAALLPVPAHVGLIMDGNGRWAKQRQMPRIFGHQKGKEVLEPLIESAFHQGIACLTLYAFSSENWTRPKAEVKGLMTLLHRALKFEAQKLHEKGVQLRVIGDRSALAPTLQREISKIEALTKDNSRITLALAINYGGRQEIVAACKEVARAVKAEEITLDAVDEATLARYLPTSTLPPLDLIIRTSGEQRLSNFLLWQSAYAELLFTPVLWPDFTPAVFEDLIHQYRHRERRYGKTSEQLL